MIDKIKDEVENIAMDAIAEYENLNHVIVHYKLEIYCIELIIGDLKDDENEI